MLKTLREKQKLVLWILLTAIIVTFSLWGAGSSVQYLLARRPPAGELYGKKVPVQAWEKARKGNIIYGEFFPSRMPPPSWIERILLVRTAGEYEIEATGREAREEILKHVPSDAAYRHTLSYLGMGAQEFEEEVLNSMRISRLRELLSDLPLISKAEVRETYEAENERYEGLGVLFEAGDFEKGVEIGEEDVGEYFEKKKATFRIPEKRRAEVCLVPTEPLEKDIKLEEWEIEDYYEEHESEFTDPEKGENLPLEEVREKIEKKLVEKRARDRAYEIAEEVYLDFLDGKPLTEAAESRSVLFAESEPLAQGEELPLLGRAPQAERLLFNTDLTEVSDIIHLHGKGYCLLRPAEEEPSRIPSLEEVREEVEDALRKESALEKAAEAAEEKRKAILAELAEGGEIEQACRDLSIESFSWGPLRAGERFPDIGLLPGGRRVLPGMKVGELGSVMRRGDKAFFLYLKGKEGIDEEKFQQERERYTRRALALKRMTNYLEWKRNLTLRAKPLDFTTGLPGREEE